MPFLMKRLYRKLMETWWNDLLRVKDERLLVLLNLFSRPLVELILEYDYSMIQHPPQACDTLSNPLKPHKTLEQYLHYEIRMLSRYSNWCDYTGSSTFYQDEKGRLSILHEADEAHASLEDIVENISSSDLNDCLLLCLIEEVFSNLWEQFLLWAKPCLQI